MKKIKKLSVFIPLLISALSISSCSISVTNEEGTKYPFVEEVIPSYTVKFYGDENKTEVIYETTVKEGESVFFPSTIPEPTKKGDKYKYYEFIKWSEPLDNITANSEIYPIFEERDQIYEVTFIGADGEILYVDKVKAGETAVYRGEEEPTKSPEGDIVYLFNGWDKDLEEVFSDFETTATFRETLKTYTVSYYSEGVRIWGKEVEAGQMIGSYNGPLPYKEPDYSEDGKTQTTYIFNGWDESENTIVTSNMVLNAQFKALENQKSDSAILGEEIIKDSGGETIDFDNDTFYIVRFSNSPYGEYYIGYSDNTDRFLIYTHSNSQAFTSSDELSKEYAEVKTFVPFKFKKIKEAKGTSEFIFTNGLGKITATFNLNSSDANILQPTSVLFKKIPSNLTYFESGCKSYIQDNLITEYNYRIRNFLVSKGFAEDFSLWN